MNRNGRVQVAGQAFGYALRARQALAMAFGLFLSCGSSRQPELAPAEVVGSRTDAIVTQSQPLTESWSRAMFGGGWPEQWSVKAISGTALNMVTQTELSGAYGLSGRANGGPTDFSIQYINTPGASFVDSEQTVKLVANSNTTWGGLIARANVETKTFYGCWVGSGSSTDRLRLFKVVNGVVIKLAHSPDPAASGLAYLAEDEWHNLELSVTQSGASTNLKARLWADGTAIPGWTLIATDAEPVLQNASGKVGIAARGGQINLSLPIHATG